jgi:hypothetical protein
MPGSLLVFPKFIGGKLGNTVVADGVVVPKTELEIAVTCPYGANCAPDQKVYLHGMWIGPGFAATQGVCPSTDFHTITSVNDKLVIRTDGSGGIPKPQPNLGMLVIWVTDPAGHPIKFDGLTGDGVIRETGTNVSEYSAIPVQGADGFRTGELIPTVKGEVGNNAGLALDGYHYKAVTGSAIADVRYDTDQLLDSNYVDSYVIFLTLDMLAGLPNPQTHVSMNFYANQVPISESLGFYCWAEYPLALIDSNLTASQMGAAKGVLVTDPAYQLPSGRPSTLLGLMQVGEGTASDPLRRGYFTAFSHGPSPVPTVLVTDAP